MLVVFGSLYGVAPDVRASNARIACAGQSTRSYQPLLLQLGIDGKRR